MARWRWIRGLFGVLALTMLCLIIDAVWIVSTLDGLTAYIQKPYNDPWYAMVVIMPAAIFWFWYFARPRKIEP